MVGSLGGDEIGAPIGDGDATGDGDGDGVANICRDNDNDDGVKGNDGISVGNDMGNDGNVPPVTPMGPPFGNISGMPVMDGKPPIAPVVGNDNIGTSGAPIPLPPVIPVVGNDIGNDGIPAPVIPVMDGNDGIPIAPVPIGKDGNGKFPPVIPVLGKSNGHDGRPVAAPVIPIPPNGNDGNDIPVTPLPLPPLAILVIPWPIAAMIPVTPAPGVDNALFNPFTNVGTTGEATLANDGKPAAPVAPGNDGNGNDGAFGVDDDGLILVHNIC